VRGALVSAIPTHLRHAPASRLSQYYARQKARLGWQVARVATARQLARIIYAMLATGECWREEPTMAGVSAEGHWSAVRETQLPFSSVCTTLLA
jgi:hypothetical protein